MSDDTVRTVVLETLGQALDEPVDTLETNPVLAAHRWDSLSSLEALNELESRLGVSFDLRSFNDAHTVDDIVGLVVGARRD